MQQLLVEPSSECPQTENMDQVDDTLEMSDYDGNSTTRLTMRKKRVQDRRYHLIKHV